MTTFRLPDLGEGLSEAEIVAWHVSAGDHVSTDQPLVSVETAKAVIEIPSPQAGHVSRIYGEPGDVLAVGAPLADIDGGPQEEHAGIVGDLPSAPETEQPAPAAAAATRDGRQREETAVRASPKVRAEARKRGIALDTVMGTGPGGAITMDDLETHPASTAGPVAEPLRGARRTMARAMARARDEVMPATVTEEADISHWSAEGDVTVRLVRAIVDAVAAEPRLNSWYDGENDAIAVQETVDLGIAQDTEAGLFVPVLRDVAAQPTDALRESLTALKTRVRERSATPDELRAPTITLSNFGMIAGLHAALVVVPPQVAILGAGRITDRVKLDGGKPVPARILPLSLSFDHRAVTGGEAARFLAAIVASLEAGQ